MSICSFREAIYVKLIAYLSTPSFKLIAYILAWSRKIIAMIPLRIYEKRPLCSVHQEDPHVLQIPENESEMELDIESNENTVDCKESTIEPQNNRTNFLKYAQLYMGSPNGKRAKRILNP